MYQICIHRTEAFVQAQNRNAYVLMLIIIVIIIITKQTFVIIRRSHHKNSANAECYVIISLLFLLLVFRLLLLDPRQDILLMDSPDTNLFHGIFVGKGCDEIV